MASPDYYDRYFSYGLGMDDISDTDLIEIIGQNNAEDISAQLTPLLRSKNQDLVLAKIRMYYKTSLNPLELAKAMVLVVGDLSRNGSGTFMDSPVEKSVDVITDIIKDSPDRLTYLKTLIDDSIHPEQLFYLVREVVLNSKDDSSDKFLEKDDFNDFKDYIVVRLKAEAHKGQLHGKDSLVGHILYQYWADFGSREEVNKYLKKHIKTAEDALDYATLHLGRWTGGKGSHRGNFDRATYGYIEKTVDIEYLYKLIIEKYPNLKGILKYIELDHSENNIAKTGNEESPEFREAFASQVVYLYEHPVKEVTE